ncbi:hypothetical protein [Vulcanococcus limneticus]|jgi:hypothetical protein|uniref:hypothetical protein n=1 Tax=Vulcanococcus limneticus TaxID=2170428 RepID=UPI00398BF417
MKPSPLLVTAAVVAVCGGLLVLFTDIEVSLVRWASCGPFATQQEDRSELCKGKL